MKTAFIPLTLFIISSVLLSGCISMQSAINRFDRFNTQFDPAKDEYRQRLELTHYPSTFSEDSYDKAKQLFIKTSSADTIGKLKVYDILQLNNVIGNYNLESTAYVILDERPFKLSLQNIDYQNFQNIESNTEEILTADSTEIEIITDYNIERSRYISTNYDISYELQTEILKTEQLLIRFYLGPLMVDYRYSQTQLRRLKELISTKPENNSEP